MILKKTEMSEMPKSCSDCPIRMETCSIWVEDYEFYISKEINTQRHELCPLIDAKNIQFTGQDIPNGELATGDLEHVGHKYFIDGGKYRKRVLPETIQIIEREIK